MTEKSIVILTNFWNAEYILHSGHALFNENNKIYKVNFGHPSKPNYSVFSIALTQPSLEKLTHLSVVIDSDENGNCKSRTIEKLDTLQFFCPTYNMLSRYKRDKDWDKYTTDYKSLLMKRKEEIRGWIGSLVPNHIYILCCWENTSLKSHCHRQILYGAFKNSKIAKEKILPFYCDGGKKVEDERPANVNLFPATEEQLISMQSIVIPTQPYRGLR